MKYELSVESINRSAGTANLQVVEISSHSRKGEMRIDKQGIATQLTSGKWAVSRIDISEIIMTPREDGVVEVRLVTKPDEKWNTRMKSKHPWRWAFGLITKSKGGTSDLGFFRTQADSVQLIDLIKALGWSVKEIGSDVRKPGSKPGSGLAS